MRKQILQMVEGIGKTQSTVGYTLGNIQVMDRVQSNMRRARDALGEAAGMAQLLATVEQTFKQGDLTTIGRQLKQIREGLESVSGVPEFAGVETKLHEFEERLQQMVQAPLQKAFEDHDAKSVQHRPASSSEQQSDDRRSSPAKISSSSRLETPRQCRASGSGRTHRPATRLQRSSPSRMAP